MRAVVTGGAGFIGSHLTDALIGRGDEVLVVDDFSSGRRENLEPACDQGARIAEVSITDRSALIDAIVGFHPQSVFHLGAQVDVRRSVADPEFDASVNVLGTVNVLDALVAAGADSSLVFASTGGAIYGEGDGLPLPLSEGASPAPEAQYGTSKLAAELYLALYGRMYDLRTVPLRFGNVYGPRQDPHGEAGVVAIFCGLLRRNEPLRVFGDGLQTRDYVYVGDVVAAILAADTRLHAGDGGQLGPLNVGTGVETSVLDLVGGLGTVAGLKPDVRHAPARKGEVSRISIDPAAAAESIGWRATTDLESGLRRTYEALRLADDR